MFKLECSGIFTQSHTGNWPRLRVIIVFHPSDGNPILKTKPTYVLEMINLSAIRGKEAKKAIQNVSMGITNTDVKIAGGLKSVSTAGSGLSAGIAGGLICVSTASAN
jgi:hypothetical protein